LNSRNGLGRNLLKFFVKVIRLRLLLLLLLDHDHTTLSRLVAKFQASVAVALETLAATFALAGL